MESFIWFDIITLSLVLILGVKGIINGFIKETFGLIGVVGGIVIASRYAQKAGDFISINLYKFDSTSTSFLVGFIVLLFSFWILALFLGYILSNLLKLSGLGTIDRLGGFIVGSAKIFLLFSIFAVALSNIDFINSKIKPYVANSFMYPLLLDTGKMIIKIKPNDLDLQNNILKNTNTQGV